MVPSKVDSTGKDETFSTKSSPFMGGDVVAGMTKQVFQFKVTLQGIRPPVWRRIQVPQDYTFWDLHVAIQDALGWQDCHLHAFYVEDPKTGQMAAIGIPDDELGEKDSKVTEGRKQRISWYFTPENPTALYVYDFGDDWAHEVRLEKIVPEERNRVYPLCLKGKRACPPEDCGGVPGYLDLLGTLTNPESDGYEDTLGWVGRDFDPEYFNPKDVVFSDPRLRWQRAFEDDVESSEGGLIEEDFFYGFHDESKEGKALSREYVHGIWQRAKSGTLDALPSGERLLGKIMLDHEDEFFNAFEFSDMAHLGDYNPDTEVNPFLHIQIHAVVETQLVEKEPIEVYQFYNAMRKKKCSHHEAVHLIGVILVPLMFLVMRKGEPFDLDTYTALLKKFKTRHPDRIPELLEKEPLLYPP